MNADKQHIDNDELLVKYLAGEASADERAQVEIWTEASVENRKYFEHFELLWNESQKLAYQSHINEDLAWNRFRERIQKETIATIKQKTNLQWLKVAAIIVLVSAAALLGPYFFNRYTDIRYTSATVNNPSIKILKSFTNDNTKVDTLPDGSVITLNANSSLEYPEAFKGQSRNVQLVGEAFFNVKHDKSKPFQIKVNDILITVLGTSFNVKSTVDKTEVIVETGIVSIKKQMNILTLYAGEKLTAFKNDNNLKKGPNKDSHYRDYFDKKPTNAKQNLAIADTGAFDINKHPDLLKQILKDPAKWSKLLKNYGAQSENITVRRAIVRSVMDEMVKEKIEFKGNIRSFRLNENELIINDERQPDAVHERFKKMFIKEPGYTVYFGGTPRNGKGIFLSPDSL